jgi:chromosome segregation ATPase
MGLVKNVVRFGVIGTLAGGGLMVVAETARPGSVSAIFGQGKQAIAGVIDRNIDDPVALRAQIAQLEAQYPKKIAEVRSDLRDVRDQITQLSRKVKESRMVVQLTQADLEQLDTGLARAREVQARNPGAIVRISLDKGRVDLRDALNERRGIEQTMQVHANLVVELERDLGYLTEQEHQLAELLTKLETEHAEFQGKLAALDMQIDSIARNDRMIAMMEDRQKTIDEHSRYRAAGLDQLDSHIARIRSEQQARLESIAGRQQDKDYLREAQYLLDVEARGDRAEPVRTPAPGRIDALLTAPEIIDVDPDAPETTTAHADEI